MASPTPVRFGGTPPWSACSAEVPTPHAADPRVKKLSSVEIVEETLRDETYHPDNQLGLPEFQSPPFGGRGDGDATPYYPPGTVDGASPNEPPTKRESFEEKSVNHDRGQGSHEQSQLGMSENEKFPTPNEIQEAGVPTSGEAQPPAMLSEAAAAARLRRVCQANSKGEYKVPMEVVAKYKDVHDGCVDLMKLFEKVGHSPDRASAVSNQNLMVFLLKDLY